MPYIKCPSCNKKSLAKLPGEFTLATWTKTYGNKPAPLTCTEANVYNECSRAVEEKERAEKKAKLAAEAAARRELALNIDEVKLLHNALRLSPVGLDQAGLDVEAKITKFLNGDNEFTVIGPAKA